MSYFLSFSFPKWCIYLNYAGVTQLEIIQCTFAKLASASDEDKIRECLPNTNIFDEINSCVNSNLGASAIRGLQTRLNLLVDSSLQKPVEVIIKDQESVKVQENGAVLQELCYNYYEFDNETLGCRVNRPTVQIFYETESYYVEEIFSEMAYQAPYAPFESIAQFEFIPYGSTSYQDGNYTCVYGEDQCKANWVHVGLCVLFSFRSI